MIVLVAKMYVCDCSVGKNMCVIVLLEKRRVCDCPFGKKKTAITSVSVIV